MHRAYSCCKSGGLNPNPWKSPQSTLAQLERTQIAQVFDFPHIKELIMKQGQLTIPEFCDEFEDQISIIEFMVCVAVYIEKTNTNRFSSYAWTKCSQEQPAPDAPEFEVNLYSICIQFVFNLYSICI